MEAALVQEDETYNLYNNYNCVDAAERLGKERNLGLQENNGIRNTAYCPDATTMIGHPVKKQKHQPNGDITQHSKEQPVRMVMRAKNPKLAAQQTGYRDQGNNQVCPVAVPSQYQRPPSTQSVAKYLHIGNEYKIRVLEVESPSLFWAWRADEDTLKHLPQLIIDMTKHYNPLTPKTGFKPTKALFAGKYAEDERWYRAQLLGFNTSSVQVLFVDFGNKDSLPFDSIHTLVSKYGTLPLQAIACGLAGFPSDKEWTPQETTRFEKQLSDANWMLDSKVVGRSCGYVMLDLTNPVTGCSVATEMKKIDTDGEVAGLRGQFDNVSISDAGPPMSPIL